MRRPLWSRLSGRTTRLWVLAALCVGAVLAIGAPTASAATEVSCGPITGSGSSLQAIVVKEVYTKNWEKALGGFTEVFGKGTEESVCKKTTTIKYTATSSGKGLAEWGASSGKIVKSEAGNGEEMLDSFVGTDVGPEGPAGTAGTQIANMDAAGENTVTKEKNGVVAIPIAKSAIAVIASLPEGCELVNSAEQPSVRSNKLLAEEWNKDAIKANELFTNVENTPACEKTLELQARESASGTTAGFKRYLGLIESTVYGPFTNNAEKSESQSEWPELANKKETGNKTGGELAERVMATQALTGYADVSDAIGKGFKATPAQLGAVGKKYWTFFAKVPNKGAEEGHKESPEASNEAANCSLATFTVPSKIGVNVDWSKATQTNATGGGAGVYPICTLTFDVLWSNPGFLESSYTLTGSTYLEKLNTLMSYFEYLLRNLSTLESSVASNHFDVYETGTTLETEYLTIFPTI